MPENKKFVIVIASFENAKHYERNLTSVINQKYPNYRVLYTDDCSSDGTGTLVADWLKENDKDCRVALKRNTKRVGALNNIYDMVHRCEDDEIIVTADGDDWLAHPDVLSKLNQVYGSGEVWITYGQYRSHPDRRIGCSRKIPDRVIRKNRYRRGRWSSSHLRTFYAWLFKRIKKKDLMKDGRFYWMTWDMAIMFPMLEMAGSRQRFIPEVLYIWNSENPISDHRINRRMQKSLKAEICAKPCYTTLSDSSF